MKATALLDVPATLPCNLSASEVRYWSTIVALNGSQLPILEEICKQADWNYGEVVNWLRAQYRKGKEDVVQSA